MNEEGALHIEKLRGLSVDDFFQIKDQLFAEIKKFEKTLTAEAQKAVDVIKNADQHQSNFTRLIKALQVILKSSQKEELIPSLRIVM